MKHREKVVLGIDPSLTSTGWAILGKHIRGWGLIKTESPWPIGKRLSIINETIQGLIDRHSPMLVVVEQGFSGGQGPSAIKNGMARGAALVACAKTPVIEPAPKSRALYATCSGNSGKPEVLARAQSHFGYNVASPSDDEADALVLAYMGLEILQAADPDGDYEPQGGWPSLEDECYVPIDKLVVKYAPLLNELVGFNDDDAEDEDDDDDDDSGVMVCDPDEEDLSDARELPEGMSL